MKKLLLFLIMISALGAKSQLYVQQGAGIYLSNATITVQEGDVVSYDSIKGSGKLMLQGSSPQFLNMNGNILPGLTISNPGNVRLSSTVGIAESLEFIAGKLDINANDLILEPTVGVVGFGAANYIMTSGSGQLKRKLTSDVTNLIFPVGDARGYRPAFLTSTGSTYFNAIAGIRSGGSASPNSPGHLLNHLNAYWPIATSGILGGTTRLMGQYNGPADVYGVETDLKGYYFNGVNWSSATETHNYALHTVSANLTSGNGELYAMNSFVLAGAKAILQGPFAQTGVTAGLMNDNLRSGNWIPTITPYKSAPFNSLAGFKAYNNDSAETVNSSVFANQASITSINDNIVDWVFLELRNTISPGNSIIATRSALIQRDGDIVDIDGKSPVVFNNVVPGNYILAVKHRNHLGLSIAISASKTLDENKSNALSTGMFDFVNAANLYDPTPTPLGKAYAISGGTVPGKALLWAGDVTSNGQVRYINGGNDRNPILLRLGGVTGNIVSGYFTEDVNMNAQVRFINGGNDPNFVLTTLLGVEGNVRSQKIPN